MALLAGRTAIVTGASSGIGQGIVQRFVEEGANVIAVSRGLESLTRSLSAFPQDRMVAVAGDAVDGVRVHAVAPGFIDTPRTAAVPDEQRNALIGVTPLQRAGTPADVAAAVTFLVSAEAAFITGVILPVDGGRQASVVNPRP